jgi:hypothetical protein
MVLKIADDRGEARAIARGAQVGADERSGDPKFRAVLEQAAAARRSVLRRSGLIGGVATIAAVVVLHTAVGMNLMAAWLVTVLGAIVLMTMLNVGRMSRGEQAAAEVYVRRGLCASCLYSLANLTAAPDGCLQCPECGAAWKQARVKQFVQFTTGGTDALADARRVGAAVTTAFGAGSVGKDGKDDRKQPCRLVPPRLAGEIDLAAGEQRERLIRARRRIARSGRILRCVVAVICLGFFVAVPGWIFVVKMRVIGGPALLMLVSVAVGLLLTWGVLRGNFGYRGKAIVRAMLAEGLCPSCAEELSEQAEADRCVVCACGAAWLRV